MKPRETRLALLLLLSAGALGLLFLWALLSGTKYSNSNLEGESMLIRVPIPYDKSLTKLDPLRVVYIDEAILIRNLYSPLVEIRHDGQLTSGAAERFSVRGKQVVFEFGQRIRTIDDTLITAKDAELSLKRLIANKKSGHGDIRNFLCPDFNLRSIEQECPGIRVEGNHLILEVTQEHIVPILLMTLEGSDFSIIPTSSLRTLDGTSEIVDYRNTSGPYYVDHDFVDGRARLKANPHHYHYRHDMPQEIELVQLNDRAAVKGLREGKFDFLTTAQSYLEEDLSPVLREKDGYSVHETLPLKVSSLFFSKKALREFTLEQRFFAAEQIAKALMGDFPLAGERPTEEFFQGVAEGSLDSKQKDYLVQLKASVGRPHFKRPIEFAMHPRFAEHYQKRLAAYPEIKVIPVDRPLFSISPEQRPDVFSGQSDSAFSEDLSLLGYNIKLNAFQLPESDLEDWLQSYIATEMREERIKRLNQLHFDMLRTASIVPFSASPYYAVTRRDWRIEMSNLLAGTRFWQLKKN